eukprot:GHVH01003708.1.p1 GENE.GHVH01003708.1~~GHVH01003708.1.p1  ORF type:complete len:696 (-),score=116.40 GHVH01003708.1:88-2175(-)
MVRLLILLASCVFAVGSSDDEVRRLGPMNMAADAGKASEEARAREEKQAQERKKQTEKEQKRAEKEQKKKDADAGKKTSDQEPRSKANGSQSKMNASAANGQEERMAKASEEAKANEAKQVPEKEMTPEETLKSALEKERTRTGEMSEQERAAFEEYDEALIKQVEKDYPLSSSYNTRNLNVLDGEEREFLAKEGIAANDIAISENGDVWAKQTVNGKEKYQKMTRNEDEITFDPEAHSKLPVGGKYRGSNGAMRRNGEPKPTSKIGHMMDKSMMVVGQISMLPMLLITPSMMGFMGSNGAYGGSWYDQWFEMLGVGDFKTTTDSHGHEVWDLEHGAMGAKSDMRDACGNYIDMKMWESLADHERKILEDQKYDGAPCISKWPYDSMEQFTDFRYDTFSGCPPSTNYGKVKKQYFTQTDPNPDYKEVDGVPVDKSVPKMIKSTYMQVAYVDNMQVTMDCHGNSISNSLWSDSNQLLMLTTSDKNYDGCTTDCSQIWRLPRPCQKQDLENENSYDQNLMTTCYEPMSERYFWRIMMTNANIQDDLNDITANMDSTIDPIFHTEFLFDQELAYIDGINPSIVPDVFRDLGIIDNGLLARSWICNVAREAQGLSVLAFGSGLYGSKNDYKYPIYDDDDYDADYDGERFCTQLDWWNHCVADAFDMDDPDVIDFCEDARPAPRGPMLGAGGSGVKKLAW